MICCRCGRPLKRASATGPGGAMGPKCARKHPPTDDLFRPPLDLDRMCAEAVQRVDAFIAQRVASILQDMRSRA